VLASVRFSAEGEGYVPPSAKDFVLPPIFESIPWFTKPILLVFLLVHNIYLWQ
jgi:F-type H+-transporting ATPase subunit a